MSEPLKIAHEQIEYGCWRLDATPLPLISKKIHSLLLILSTALMPSATISKSSSLVLSLHRFSSNAESFELKERRHYHFASIGIGVTIPSLSHAPAPYQLFPLSADATDWHSDTVCTSMQPPPPCYALSPAATNFIYYLLASELMP